MASGAPIHLVFFDAYDQRVLMKAWGDIWAGLRRDRTLRFRVQLAAYTSPVLPYWPTRFAPAQLTPALPFTAIAHPVPWFSLGRRTPVDTDLPRTYSTRCRFEDGEVPDGDTTPIHAPLPLQQPATLDTLCCLGQLPRPQNRYLRPYRPSPPMICSLCIANV